MQQLDPKSIWLFFIGFFFGPSTVIIALVISMMISIPDADKGTLSFGLLIWLWVIIPALLIFSWIWAKLTYRFYRYELREDGFRKEFGVIWKTYVTIPYDRIQNVDIYRGVIARILGLSDLKIQTAGASTHGVGAEGKLPGLSREVAEQLRDELIKRARQSKTTNQGL